MPRQTVERGYMVIAIGKYPAIFEDTPDELERAREYANTNRATLLRFEPLNKADS